MPLGSGSVPFGTSHSNRRATHVRARTRRGPFADSPRVLACTRTPAQSFWPGIADERPKGPFPSSSPRPYLAQISRKLRPFRRTARALAIFLPEDQSASTFHLDRAILLCKETPRLRFGSGQLEPPDAIWNCNRMPALFRVTVFRLSKGPTPAVIQT